MQTQTEGMESPLDPELEALRKSYKETPKSRTHRPHESAKFCKVHGTHQRREIKMSGPFHRADCKEIQEGWPRISDRRTWWNVGPVRWLIAPDYDDWDCWWIVEEKGFCDECAAEAVRKGESPQPDIKLYRRKFGWARLNLVLRPHSTICGIFNSDSFRIVGPAKKPLKQP